MSSLEPLDKKEEKTAPAADSARMAPKPDPAAVNAVTPQRQSSAVITVTDKHSTTSDDSTVIIKADKGNFICQKDWLFGLTKGSTKKITYVPPNPEGRELCKQQGLTCTGVITSVRSAQQ